MYATNTYSQTIIKEFKGDSSVLYFPKNKILKNKIVPFQYENITRMALLYYPELENTKIKIVVKKKSSPLTARPCIFTL